MQVKEDNKMHIFNGAMGDEERNDPRFTTTQFQILQRKEILYPVIDAMKLMQKWEMRSREVAYNKLHSMMTPTEVRNTDLIMISVLDKDRQEAADLANTIAVEYQKKRIDEQQSWVARGLVQLEDEVTKQRSKTEELHDAMTKIRQEANIIDLDTDNVEENKGTEDTVLMTVKNQVSDMRIKVATLRSKQEQIQAMTDDQIMRSLKTFEMEDSTVAQIFPSMKVRFPTRRTCSPRASAQNILPFRRCAPGKMSMQNSCRIRSPISENPLPQILRFPRNHWRRWSLSSPRQRMNNRGPKQRQWAIRRPKTNI